MEQSNYEMDGKCRTVVIINGSGGCGKDEFVNQCKPLLETEDAHSTMIIRNISTVDTVKDIAETMGYCGEKTDASRLFLSELKRIWDDYNNGCTEDALKKVRSIINYERILGHESLVFLHCREPEKIEQVKNRLISEVNVITLLVKNDTVEEITTNYSDGSVNDYCYDYVLYNDCSAGLMHLRDCAETFLEEIGFLA